MSLAALTLSLAFVVPSTALATPEFEAEEYPAVVEGEQQVGEPLVFTAEVGEVECESIIFSGELLDVSETLALAPEFLECTALGLEATIDPEGCVFVLKAEEETGEVVFGGAMDISCPAGKAISVTVLESELCDIRIGGQTGLGTVTYQDNLKKPSTSITAEAGIGGVQYSMSGLLCSAESEEGEVWGSVDLTAAVEGEAVDLAIAQDKPTKLCKKDPSMSKDVCPPNEEYGVTSFEATAQVPSQPIGAIFIMKKPATVENVVQCKESKLVGKTQEAVGQPLNVENVSVTFAKCETPAPTQCTVTMENAPAPGEFAASTPNVGSGLLRTPITMRIKCGAEVDCRYAVTLYRIVVLGANVATMQTPGKHLKLIKQVITPEAGCFDFAEWNNTYAVAKPQPLWVSH